MKSINVSGHKYGLVYAGIGWVIWRTKDDLPEELIFHIKYLGAEQSTFTLNFSKGDESNYKIIFNMNNARDNIFSQLINVTVSLMTQLLLYCRI